MMIDYHFKFDPSPLPPAIGMGSGGRESDSTRERLLDAAELLFAERGYDGVSLRQVTSAAHCNIASVNYHFGTKDGLYKEIYRRRLQEMREQRIRGIRQVLASGGDLQELLRVFATVFLEPVLDHEHGPLILKLWMQELTGHHLPPHMLMEEMVMPVSRALIEAFSILVPELSEADAMMVIHSLVGQLVHLVMCAPMFGESDATMNPLCDVHAAVDHVVRFSYGGILAITAEHATAKTPLLRLDEDQA